MLSGSSFPFCVGHGAGHCLPAFMQHPQEGMNKMWDEMRKTKEQFVTMVGTLGRKQVRAAAPSRAC